jgi:Uri superfamily endonuclease
VAKRLKGIYVLIIQINQTIQPKIGALGELTFTEGLYAYVGSAQNNLELRVARHRRREKRLFWHIDYLLNNEAAKVMTVYYKPGRKTEECKIASLLEANAQPIARFGCSDCTCSSHLFHAQNFDFLQGYMQPLKALDATLR